MVAQSPYYNYVCKLPVIHKAALHWTPLYSYSFHSALFCGFALQLLLFMLVKIFHVTVVEVCEATGI